MWSKFQSELLLCYRLPRHKQLKHFSDTGLDLQNFNLAVFVGILRFRSENPFIWPISKKNIQIWSLISVTERTWPIRKTRLEEREETVMPRSEKSFKSVPYVLVTGAYHTELSCVPSKPCTWRKSLFNILSVDLNLQANVAEAKHYAKMLQSGIRI